MTDADDPPISRDAKNGWSSFCRRGDHATCVMVQARCTCPDHGKNGQAPPTPARSRDAATLDQRTLHIKETVMPADTQAPSAVNHCEPCDRDFPSAQGLALHRTRSHTNGNGHKPKAPKPATPKSPPKPKAAAEHAPEHIVIVFTTGGGVVTDTYKPEVAATIANLLRRLDHRVAVIDPDTLPE